MENNLITDTLEAPEIFGGLPWQLGTQMLRYSCKCCKTGVLPINRR